MRKIESVNNKLLWGGIVVEDLAKKYGTPLYIYDEKILLDAITELEHGPWEIHYALKANPCPELLRLTISPPNFLANLTAISVLPLAVGPAIAIIGFFISL